MTTPEIKSDRERSRIQKRIALLLELVPGEPDSAA
jgi:hypothetical protein